MWQETLSPVLNVARHGHPGMHSLFINRERRCREARVCEGTNRDRNTFRHSVNDVVDRAAARGAKGEPCSSAFVANPNILRVRAADLDSFPRKSRLRSKDAPSSTLARITMTHRNPDRLARDFCLELAATASCDSSRHGQAPGAWQTASTLCPSGPITKAA